MNDYDGSGSSSSGRLLVLLRAPGAISETFIRRHVEQLDPRGSIVMSYQGAREGADWQPPGPHLDLSRLGFPTTRVARAFKSFGFSNPRRLLNRASREEVHRFLLTHGVETVLGEYLDITATLQPFVEDVEKLFVHAHGYDISASLRRLMWRRAYRALRSTDGIIVVSNHARERLLKIGMPAQKLHVIPYGVPGPDPFYPSPVQDRLRLLVVGRMVPKKATLLAIQAVEQAARAGLRLQLDLVGDGPLLPAVKAYVRERELDWATVHGAAPPATVIALMTRAHLFVQHSVVDPRTGDEEGLPLAILEALAHGVPVVATKHAGIPEAVTDGVEGRLVNEGDVQAMAKAIINLGEDEPVRQLFAAAARRRWERDFTWTLNRERLRALLFDA